MHGSRGCLPGLGRRRADRRGKDPRDPRSLMTGGGGVDREQQGSLQSLHYFPRGMNSLVLQLLGQSFESRRTVLQSSTQQAGLWQAVHAVGQPP